jgi:hypothetical protein
MRRAPRKLPFDIDEVVRRIRNEVKGFADAAMFALAAAGYSTVFQQLVGCIISIRTRDEVSLPASIKLLERAPTAEAVARLSEREIDSLIAAATFHEGKARRRRIWRRASLRLRSARFISRRRAEMREPGIGSRLRREEDLGGHPRASRDEPLGLRREHDSGGHAARARAKTAEGVLDRNQPAACAVRKTRLHRPAAEVLDVSGAGVLQAGRCNSASMTRAEQTAD